MSHLKPNINTDLFKLTSDINHETNIYLQLRCFTQPNQVALLHFCFVTRRFKTERDIVVVQPLLHAT